jgi:hypothetical protein
MPGIKKAHITVSSFLLDFIKLSLVRRRDSNNSLNLLLYLDIKYLLNNFVRIFVRIKLG